MGRISTPWLRQSAKPRRARRATLTSIKGNTTLVQAPGCWWHPRGVSSAPHSLAERALGAKKRRHKGSARAPSVERFLRSKTRRAVRRSLAELSERPLRGGLPVLRCCPSACFRSARPDLTGYLPASPDEYRRLVRYPLGRLR